LKSSEETRDIKVILVSSKSQESDRFWGLKQGADDYIFKPYQDETLLAAVKRHL
jgi:DNA-binding response OmpR family regulator